MKSLVSTSKFISKVLRHDPEKYGIKLDKAGWTTIADVIECVQKHSTPDFDRTQLQELIDRNDKKRFEVSEDDKQIRARQGHSVPVELGYTPSIPPQKLYHGTTREASKEIRISGIKKMKRHAVHLTENIDLAKKRGYVLVVDSQKMHADGYVFFVTDNKVWLTDYVPVSYIGSVSI